MHWENYPIIQQTHKWHNFFISFGTNPLWVYWQNHCCQFILDTSLIQFGWTKRPWELFCSVLIVLTALGAAELDKSDTESEIMMVSMVSLSLLHMTVVRVTQVTRRRDTRLIRRTRITSEVREEVLSSGSVTAARRGIDW